jgi:hypothetical protein
MSTTHKLSPAEVKQRLVRIGKSRRTHRWLLGIIIAIVVFGLLGFFAAPPLIRHVAEQQLGKALDRPVSIGRIALNPYTLNFEADRVAIAEPGNTGPFISLDKLIVRPSWGSLFRLAPVVNELTIQAPHFHIVRTAPQRFNFSDLVDKFSKPSPQPAGKPFGFSVSNIKLVDGRIDFDDRVLNAQHVIDDWQVGVPFIATLQSKTDIYVQPLLKMRIDGSPLSVTGKTKPFASTRESDIALQLQGLDVPKLLSYSPTPLPVAVTKGALSSDLDIRFLIDEKGPKLTVTGTVDLADLAVTDHAGTVLANAGAVHVAAGSIEPLRRVFHFDEVRLDKAVVNLSRDAQGKLNVLSLPAPPPVATRAAAPAADSTATVAPAVQSAASQPTAQAAAPAPSASVVASASAPAPASASSASASPDAAAAPPLDFAVARLSINNATIHVVDHLPAGGPTRFDATDLNVGVTRFATLSKDPAHYTLTSGFNDGASLKVDGDLWLGAGRTSLKLDAKGIALAPQQPYLSAFLAGTVTKGTLDLGAPIDVDWSKAPLALHIGNASVGLDDVQLVAEESKEPVLGIGHALAQIDHVDLGAREAIVSSVELDGLAVKGQRLRDGSIDLMKLQRGGAAATESATGSGPGAAQAPALQAAAKVVKGAPEQQPWHYRIDSLALHKSSIEFADRTTAKPVLVAIEPLDFTLKGLSEDFSKPWQITTAGTLNRSGTFDADGRITLKPLDVALRLNGKRLDLAAVEPYFGQYLNVTVASARVNASGELTLSGSGAAMKTGYKGDAAMIDVRMLDKITSQPFGGWGTLSFSKLAVSHDEKNTSVSAGLVTFASFYGSVVLDKQGRLNLKDVVAEPGTPKKSMATEAANAASSTEADAKPASKTESKTASSAGAASHIDAAAAAKTPASAAQVAEAATAASSVAADTLAAASSAAGQAAVVPASSTAVSAGASGTVAGAGTPAAGASGTAANVSKPGLDLRFSQLVLQKGRAVYADNFVQPNFTARLIDINGTIGAFGTRSTTSAPVDIKANLAANGPVTIKGSINPLTRIPSLDVTAAAHDVELTNLTPYSTKYAGYPITKGKLNVDLHYVLDNDHLSADNHLFIDQLTFGDHVDNATATKLPVKFALALLTNSRGEIDVNIPVSGSLSNPQFSVGALIWQAVLNLLEKAVTAPFSLIASAFGGHGEELGYVEFAPGLAKLSDDQKKKLDTIAKVLNDKTSIKLDLIGRVDPKVDEPALRQASVDQQVKAQKIKDVVGKGESIDTDEITIAPDEYDKYLTRAWKAADFKKETNLVGLTKSQPDDVMKQALLDHAKVDAEELRQLAQRRAASVLQYFEGKTDLARVYIVSPKLDADGIKDKGATTRVDFNLK